MMDRSLVPPGGFRYRQPESGVTLRASSFLNLVDVVRGHRVANHYPITPTFEAEVEHGVCSEVPQSCAEVPATKSAKMLTLSDVLRLTALLGESLLRGQPTVEPAEAERRASVCVGCRDNQNPEGCAPCKAKQIGELISGMVGASVTSRDTELKACRHCGCFNRAQVWLPLDLLHRHADAQTLSNLPPHCWKKP